MRVDKTPTAFTKELDDFQSRRPIDVICRNRPILILDEPQKMEGAKSMDALKEFTPLMVLRYSATHKQEHNKIYRLDALDAYNQKLVKKIAVRAFPSKAWREPIRISTWKESRSPRASRRRPRWNSKSASPQASKRDRRKLHKNDNLYAMSKELEQYKGFTVADINALWTIPSASPME